MVLLVGLQCVIMVFPGQIHLLFAKASCKPTCSATVTSHYLEILHIYEEDVKASVKQT